ncbi:TonB-dependent receptor domain-containing protein [Aeromonas veronii]|uniref:TonB-dependent receptor domain-containing protein n=1 Tax=Aeromonas veronii TaxID=654 RepID=UPI0019334B08|nr:TonB-dependent receptor [Aeromonas veronii]MBM0416131.1 TonB-dependent receptor [Aeromonas veronii]MBW3789017.1 TonB-dependent receptor [Aeromonas veronii]
MKSSTSRFIAPSLLATTIVTLLTQQAIAASNAPQADEVITVTTTAHNTRSAPASISVITAEQIKAAPVNDLADLLRHEVGIQAEANANGRSEIGIRGMSGKYTLVLVDGKRLSSSNAMWRGGDFDNTPVPLGMIQRVEVIRGPMSALYGSDAIGGVINIITKQPGKTWQGAADADFKAIEGKDGGDQHRTNLGFTGPLTDNLLIRMNGEVYDRQAWTPPEAAYGIPLIEAKQTRNFASTLSWLVDEQQRFELDYLYNQDERPLDIFRKIGNKVHSRQQQNDRNLFGLTHKGNWNWGDTTVMVNYESSKIDDFNDILKIHQQPKEENNFTVKGYTNLTLANHYLTLGGEYLDRELVDAVSYKDIGGKESHSQEALFAQDEIGLTDSLNLTLGGRYDHHGLYGSHFTPRGYLVYEMNDVVTVKGGVSQAFKAPASHQYTNGYSTESCGGRCSIYGNDKVKPETSTNYELGIIAGEGVWETSSTLFYSDIDDMLIGKEPPGSQKQYSDRTWYNLDKATNKGLELTGKLDLTDGINLGANYTYLKAEDDKGLQIINRPKHKTNAKLTWQATERVNAFVGTTYTGTQFIEHKVNNATVRDKLPSYQTFDLGTGFKVTENFDLRLGINNLTDVRLQEKDSLFQNVEPGRSYYVSGSARF